MAQGPRSAVLGPHIRTTKLVVIYLRAVHGDGPRPKVLGPPTSGGPRSTDPGPRSSKAGPRSWATCVPMSRRQPLLGGLAAHLPRIHSKIGAHMPPTCPCICPLCPIEIFGAEELRLLRTGTSGHKLSATPPLAIPLLVLLKRLVRKHGVRAVLSRRFRRCIGVQPHALAVVLPECLVHQPCHTSSIPLHYVKATGRQTRFQIKEREDSLLHFHPLIPAS